MSNAARSVADGASSVTCSAAPPSKYITMSSVSALGAWALRVASAARRMSSRAMAAPPTSSPSYSSSSLPVIAGSAAYTSVSRGTTSRSLPPMARRSAFETTFSSTEIGMRCDTPERRSTRLSVRASKATRSTSSLSSGGTRTGGEPPAWRAVHASCRVIAIPSSTSSG